MALRCSEWSSSKVSVLEPAVVVGWDLMGCYSSRVASVSVVTTGHPFDKVDEDGVLIQRQRKFLPT